MIDDTGYGTLTSHHTVPTLVDGNLEPMNVSIHILPNIGHDRYKSERNKLDGTKQTVTTPNSTSYLDISNNSDPADKFRIASVADYTFIANREKVCTMDFAGTYTQNDAASTPAAGTVITVTSTGHGKRRHG